MFCYLAEKKCGEKCCDAEQECIEGECKCPEDKPTACGDTCCSAEQMCYNGNCLMLWCTQSMALCERITTPWDEAILAIGECVIRAEYTFESGGVTHFGCIACPYLLYDWADDFILSGVGYECDSLHPDYCANMLK